ncbi:hypothetical protein LUZ60_016677 [Juncus effusus]|nr:hypothetical protein LUZ60_016677 [Juncus effusus]
MELFSLFMVASVPVIEVLLIGLLGAFLASYNILSADARKSINKIVFVVFAPALCFKSLAKTVTFREMISWWFMPVNIGITFLLGGILGWIAVKILRPEHHLEGLIIASCSAGNLGNLPIIVVPAICNENGSPFGNATNCKSLGLAYVSFSMALGGFYIWTHTYNLMKKSAVIYEKSCHESGKSENPYECEESDTDQEAFLLPSSKLIDENEQTMMVPLLSSGDLIKTKTDFIQRARENLKETIHQILEELLTPPTIAAILGFVIGAIPALKKLLIGVNAPLKAVQDSIILLGDGAIPCVTLILGGNLTQGLRKMHVRPLAIFAIISVRYVILPICGIGVVKAAAQLGFLPDSPLYHFVLLIQFTLPPAMSIGTMAQLFDVAQEECSVIFLWTYLVAAFAFTVWSTVFMWIVT